MIGGCAVGVESYIMTCLNFVPEPAFELIEFAKGNKDVKHARKCQQKINDIVCTVTCYGKYHSMQTKILIIYCLNFNTCVKQERGLRL